MVWPGHLGSGFKSSLLVGNLFRTVEWLILETFLNPFPGSQARTTLFLKAPESAFDLDIMMLYTAITKRIKRPHIWGLNKMGSSKIFCYRVLIISTSSCASDFMWSSGTFANFFHIYLHVCLFQLYKWWRDCSLTDLYLSVVFKQRADICMSKYVGKTFHKVYLLLYMTVFYLDSLYL